MAPLFKRSGTTVASLASLTFWRSLLAQRLLTQCTSVLGLPATPGSPMLMPSSTSAGIFWGPNKGIILRPDVTKSFEVHVDCDFAGNWNKEDAMIDPSTTKSQTGYVISYAGCPTIWASELQTKVVLSTTESEYVGLSESLCIAIVMMKSSRKCKSRG